MSEREFSLEKLKRGFAAAPCGVGVFAIGTRDPLFLNDAYYRMTDYTSQEYAQLIANEDRKLLFSLDLPIIEQAEQRYRDDGTLSGAQYRVVQKNGGVCWVDLTMVSIRADERDCALCFFENITAQKENFTHMKLVTDSIGSGICVMRVKDGTESLLYANDAFFSLMGIDRKAYLQNAHAFDDVFTSQEDKKRTRDAIRESIRTGTPQELTYRFFRPGSGTVWMEQKLFSVSQDEAGTHLIASVVADVTDKKQAEFARALEQRRYRLVIDEMKAAVFEWDVRSGAFYCSENYKEYAISQVPPEVILANKGSADMIHPDDTPAKLKFFADTHGGTSRAEGILRMKLTAGGYRWCRLVGLFYKDESGRPTRTLGIIIDISQEKEKSVMFETFTQEKNDVVPQYQGSGLGLAIVKQLVDLMGAQISVKSKLGEGTEFTLCFRFPVVQSAGEGQDAVVSFAPGQLKGRRVLLAEDHPLNTMIAVKLLEKVGMTVVAVQNGQEAVNQFQAAGDRRFDAILMDIRMPVMNGLEAAKAIRRIDRSDAKTIPILAMTANAFDSDVQESLQAGMNAHLAKPIEPEKMYQKLLSLIMAREGKAK